MLSTPRLALHSLWNRRTSAALIVLAIGLSVLLLLGVEKVRTQARSSFASTISGTDLIIGARTSPLQLLLYSVFHIGDATNNFSWDTYRQITAAPGVRWSVPIALGDSHRGYRVIGTSQEFFEHYRYGAKLPLEFAQGRPFDGLYDAVIGAEVAKALGYGQNQRIVIAHGAGNVSLIKHDDQPFQVVGILARTGTPVDRSLLVSLEAIEAIHIGWEAGMPSRKVTPEDVAEADLQPTQLTAALLGLESQLRIFSLQRQINQYSGEAMTAILPGATLSQLWRLLGNGELALRLVSAMVALTSLLGMLTTLLSGLRERRRELAILRSVGARPWHLVVLVTGEAAALTLAGILLGCLLYFGLLFAGQDLVHSETGLYLSLDGFDTWQWGWLGIIAASGSIMGLVPALLAYRNALADGLLLRV